MTEPARQPELRLVGCPDCERKDRECERKDRQMASMQIDLDNHDARHKADMRIIEQLKTDRAERLRADPQWSLAMELGRYWIEECGKDPKKTALGMKRIPLVLARLKERQRMGAENPARDVAKAILGAKYDAFVNSKGVPQNDLALICRDEEKFESFIDRFERYRARHGSGSANGNGRAPQLAAPNGSRPARQRQADPTDLAGEEPKRGEASSARRPDRQHDRRPDPGGEQRNPSQRSGGEPSDARGVGEAQAHPPAS